MTSLQAETSKGNILIVDDSLDNLRVLSATLTEQGYEVRCVKSGSMALIGARSAPPDLILLDIRLPGLDGYDICQKLKTDERSREIPVIFLSALNAPLDKVKAFEVGGVDYITKPFQIEEVLARVENQLAIQRLQKQLTQQNVQLQREVWARQQAEEGLRKALSKEKELSDLKSRFISTASHEFRTPLTAILMSSEILRNYSHKLTDEDKQQHHVRIRMAVQRMTELLDDVLIVGRAGAGKLKFQPELVDLVQYCKQILEELQLINPQRTIDFVTQGICENANFDPQLLRQILINLLTNALKYSAPESPVHFSLSYHDSQAIFQIRDQGIGIPPEDLPHLFEAFHRAPNVGTTQGTGLGLTIVRQAAELHGGQIEVESELGIGTTFTVSLPSAVMPPPAVCNQLEVSEVSAA